MNSINFQSTRRSRPSGQAIVELVVSIVAIAVVFTGMLVITDIAKGSVENLIEARRLADSAAGTSGTIVGSGGSPIKTWDAGGDLFMFTADDIPVPADDENSGTFKNELNIDKQENHLNLETPPVNFSHNLQNFYTSASLFLDAANLTTHGESQKTVPADNGIVTEDMFRLIGGRPSITIKDSVYMPGILE